MNIYTLLVPGSHTGRNDCSGSPKSVASPEVAAGVNRYMAMLLSERLMFTTRTLRAVSA